MNRKVPHCQTVSAFTPVRLRDCELRVLRRLTVVQSNTVNVHWTTIKTNGFEKIAITWFRLLQFGGSIGREFLCKIEANANIVHRFGHKSLETRFPRGKLHHSAKYWLTRHCEQTHAMNYAHSNMNNYRRKLDQ